MRSFSTSIGVSAALIALSGCMAVFPAVEGEFERTLDVTGPVELEVFTGSGNVEVSAGNPGSVRIYGLIRARDDFQERAEEKLRYLQAYPPIEQNGSVIRIGRIEESRYRNNVSISYVIETPHETQLVAKTGSGRQRVNGLQGSVEAATGSGSITIANIVGDVSAHTGSGRIELLSVTGRADLSTGSGSIRAEGIAGSISAGTGSGRIWLQQRAAERGAPLDVEARSGSGSIEVAGVAGSLRASTGSGGITANGSPIGDWSIHAASGSVTLEIPRDTPFDLHARTGSGRISVDHPLEVSGSIRRNELNGKVRGGGRLVEVKTSSGRITIH